MTNNKLNKSFLGLPGALLLLAGVLAVSLLTWNLTLQKSNADLNTKIAELEQTQLPSKVYASYEDCIADGGVTLNTINAGFNGCLGGDETLVDSTADLDYPVQLQAFLQYSAQNLPRINETKTAVGENKVTAEGYFSQDLIDFLKTDYTGCETRGEYQVVKELAGRFALMKYGCDGDGQVQSDNPPRIISMKLADRWVLLSPTNNMDDKGRPSCLLTDMFKISKDFAPKCFENTGYNNGTLRKVTYQ